MNLKEIKEMINLMNENELMEMEVEREGSKIKLKKAYSLDSSKSIVSQPIVSLQAQPIQQQTVQEIQQASTGVEIVSPMVGTFYRASSPDSLPYVEVGQIVEVGQVVCIVEAMKLMNEIKSEIRGKIISIPVENANPVEFGQVLFVVEPE